MSLEISLKEICASLTSSRVTDRKKNAEALKEFLSRNAVPSLLTANTLKKKGYTWSELFSDINEYILKETEKYESSKTFESTTIPLISSLLNLCVAGSNKGKAYIRCDQVIEAVLFILKDSRLTKATGDCYLSVLHKHVLSCDHYVHHITPTHWEDLMSVCLSASTSKHCNLDDYTKMRLLWNVIKHSKNNCQFTIPLRDSLSKLKKCLAKFLNDKKAIEIVIEILVLLLETLSLEYRQTMCDFIEHLLSPVLKTYDQNLDQKKKTPLYKLFYLTMMLHHPKGSLKTEEGSLANNWDIWEKQMSGIMEIIWLEASIMQKLGKQNQKLLKPNMDYCNLAASVYYQIFNTLTSNSSTSNEDLEGGNTSKRQRTTINKYRNFTDLVEELRQNPTPWLDTLHMYIKKFGHTVSTHDYIALIGVIDFLLINNNNSINWPSLESTACTAINNLMSNVTTTNEYKDECEVVFLSLWNSCVRTSTLASSVHKASHAILQVLLCTDTIKYEDALPLYKLYYEKGMPFTNNSLKTLTELIHKYFYKSSYYEERVKSFGWFIHSSVTFVDSSNVKMFLIRLLANENVNNKEFSPEISEYEHLHNVIFGTFDESILFSDFELSVPTPHDQIKITEVMGINIEMNRDVYSYFNTKLSEYIDKIKDIPLLEYIKFTKTVIAYIDAVIKCDQMQRETLKDDQLLRLLKNALKIMYLSMTNYLKSNKESHEKVKLLQSVFSILGQEYDPMINSLVRTMINDDFFHCINNIMNKEVSVNDDEILYEDCESEMNPNILRHNCICLLAAYCKKTEAYTDEVLKLILDPTLYSFVITWDVEMAFECISILLDSNVSDQPIESIFSLMQHMCKDLFRNPEYSFRLLKVLSQILEKLWLCDGSMKQNCFIMVKSYLQRSLKLFYPPHVAAMVYECAGKIASLNQRRGCELDSNFVDALQHNIKGNQTHSLRLYCAYLGKLLFGSLSHEELESQILHLGDIFVVEIPERHELILRDEVTNRTLTILHNAFALTQIKSSNLQAIINQVILLQKEKSLEKKLVKRVLNRISNNIAKQNLDVYLNENILAILNYWFCNDKTLDDLPLQIFGCLDLGQFVEKHANWLIAAEVLWLKQGVIKYSSIIKHIQTKTGKSVESILEGSISNIIALCVPYIVTEKYKLTFSFPGKWEWAKSAEIMFQSTRQILGDEKWSTLFAENMSDLILLTATHMKDHEDAKIMYHVNIPKQFKSYHYSKEVFSGILQYFGILIDENVMNYLCENQPLTIFRSLFALWKDVLSESMYEYKILSLHSYVNFLENIPLGHLTDAFVCNFACNSLAHAIQNSSNNDEIKVYAMTLKIVLEKYMKPTNMKILKNSVHQILSILMIKKEEGFSSEIIGLFNYLTEDMKEYLKDNEDVVDFVSSLSQRSAECTVCTTKAEFTGKLKTHQKSLAYPSYETLAQMRRFLQTNKFYVNNLSDEINCQGFSDDCKSSALHQIIYSLCCTIKSGTDNKTVIEASNCLAEIGNYDLKTLVTVSPTDSQKVVDLRPRQYFASAVLGALSNVLFDENPTVVNLTAKSLKSVLKYREGKDALDLDCLNKPMLIPFISSDGNEFAEFKINNAKFKLLCLTENWIPRQNEAHSDWLIRITLNLLDVLATQTNYLLQLRKVCNAKPCICRQVLPPLIGLILDCASEPHVKIISDQINRFFKHIWDINFDETVESSYDSNIPKQCDAFNHNTKMIVQYMLDVVNFVRLQRNHYKPRAERTFDTLNYLHLQYDKVAWAATIADRNMTAIYYGELWSAAGNQGIPPDSPEATTQLDGGKNLQKIFRKCFVSIGEMDALDGCGTTHLTIEDERRKHLINTGQYMDSLLLHDIALSCPGHNRDLQHGAVKSLHKSGMHHLALQYIKSLPETDGLNDIKYECLSFLGDWSNFVDTRDLEEKLKLPNCNIQSIIKAYRYSCLKDCINLEANYDFENKLVVPLNRAKLAVARLSQNLNMENCQSVYNVLSKLHLFNDIEDYFSVRSDKLNIDDLLKKWEVKNMPPCHDFKNVEALIYQRSLILENAARTFSNSLKDIVSLQLQYADLSLNNQRIQMAQRLLAAVTRLHTSEDVALVDAQISWTKGHKDIALSLLRNIVTSPSNGDAILAAMSLRQYGIWMAESKCDNTRDIINKYLKKSLEALKGSDHEDTRLKIYYDIATFADAEYKQVVAYMNSSLFEKTVKCVEGMKDTACTLRSTQALTRDERKALAMNDKFGEIDEAIIASTRSEKETFLQLAMRYYLLSLKQGETNNLSIFRIISLWLDNPTLALSDDGEQSFEDLLHAIPSYKYITVLPQLGPRLTNESSPFAENLNKIMKRCAHDHPHHTLPILFSLKNSDKDKMILNASENIRSGSSQRARTQEPRVAAADVIVTQLASEHESLRRIIDQMEKICDATISFANYLPKTKETKQKIPAAERIHKLGPLNAIPVPTDTIAINKHCKYSYVPTIYSFENFFELVGGINCPKKIICRRSDAKKRILLIKGEDDLRQDAVMQQVFNIVNTLLEKDPVTSRNKLLIRTYKVVPMSRKSGVLEWCEGTMPIGAYLVGNNGAHIRYRPQDITASAARTKLTSLHEKRKPHREKLVAFLKILKEFRPVFHYFFTEHYLDPVTWFERRLAYTKSVATSSMVGYILGLGDRHLQNILIDKKTAEVVHIDFGIAFEQGKTLPTPETIPFRLTQDIIAGFGCSGVEGVFRRCCEKTMQLLRDNQETLLTILEVLLCDPLYSWTVTSKQQNVLTAPSKNVTINQSSGSDGSLAKRALMTVGNKLSGTEGGVAAGVSVTGQVARLIQTATDPANLSRLFPGWQPFL